MGIDINQYDNLYFLGAGGIGMSALERYFLMRGKKIAGYDLRTSTLTAKLIDEGVELIYDDDPDLIPDYCRDPKNTLVVYTAAIKDDTSCAVRDYFKNNGFTVIKRAKLLGIVTRHTRGLCFSGTHGKTTTSNMAAHIMESSGVGSNAFLGGVMKNYDTTYLLSETSPYTVVEADEYDRSFHELSPYVAVVTSTDHDHTDIYPTEADYLESFAHFTELIQPGGFLIVHAGLKLKPRPGKDVTTYTYGREDGDFHATNIRKEGLKIMFDLVTPWETIRDIYLGVSVDINIENAIAAMAACRVLNKVPTEAMRKAMGTFQGTKRRFEFWIEPQDKNSPVMIDDYAHHPRELKASINSIRNLFPDRQLTVIFQPHTYTRTRDLAKEFAESLSLADEVILIPIYPAREAPIPGVDSNLILNQVTCTKKCIYPKENLIDSLDFSTFDVLLTAGAGDIDKLLPGICDKFKKSKR